jgi:hypothetical protein
MILIRIFSKFLIFYVYYYGYPRTDTDLKICYNYGYGYDIKFDGRIRTRYFVSMHMPDSNHLFFLSISHIFLSPVVFVVTFTTCDEI